MADEWKAYKNDKRTVCKYGTKCYQKNQEHHANFKHPPPKLKGIRKNNRFKPYEREKPVVQERKPEAECRSDALLEYDEASSLEEQVTSSNHIVNVKLPQDVTFLKVDEENKKSFKEHFLVNMPPDFFKFYECLSQDNAEKTLSGVNLQLIGPYELLMGKLPDLDDKELYLIHWRFFYDPPEFQSVLKVKGKDELHFGYYRDDPNQDPVFVASNDSSKGYQLTPVSSNIFGAVYLYLTNEKNHTPFNAMACKQLSVKVQKWAADNGFLVKEYEMKPRLAQIVTKTFHGAGIVVPYDKKTQLGYRKLVESDSAIKKLFSKLEKAKTSKEKDTVLSELQPVITYANIAVDECDFGTGLEAGINMFCSGIKELEASALGCLISTYSLLKREAFGKIIEAHLKYRRKGPNMSVLNISQ